MQTILSLKPAITVFAASTDKLSADIASVAFQLGCLLAKAGFKIVYGGGNNGLMGQLALGAKAGQGELIGIITQQLRKAGFCFEEADLIIEARNLAERKLFLLEKGSAFICLPGGIGTLDEFFSVLAEKQLGFHSKPILLMNYKSFYTPLYEYLLRLQKESFLTGFNNLVKLIATPQEALEYLKFCQLANVS